MVDAVDARQVKKWQHDILLKTVFDLFIVEGTRFVSV